MHKNIKSSSRPLAAGRCSLNGWIAVNKPIGMGSTDVVNRVKRLLKSPPEPEAESGDTGAGTRSPRKAGNKVKIGHCGTLDPLADGVLILAVGEATKLVQYVMDLPKIYDFTITWGEQRDTDDGEGQVIATSDKRPTKEEIENILPRFTGVIGQVPPKFSAIKIGGERAYDLARAGQEVEIPPRPVTIHTFEILDYAKDSANFRVECGKGTYVRSLARDIGQALGTQGYISKLTRSGLGKCLLACTISLEKLEELVHKGASTSWLHPVEWMLDDIPAWSIPPGVAKIVRQGNIVRLIPKYTPEALARLPEGALISVNVDGQLLALCEIGEGLLKPVRVFNLRGQRPAASGQ